MTVKIVTDSTSDLPYELAEDLGITVAPLNVHFGTETYKDGVDITAEEFYQRLIVDVELPRTSQPSTGEFVEIYNRLGVESDGIVSVHLSSKVSGTYNSAIQAKSQMDINCPIEVLDTQQASMGVGMIAIKAAKAALDGNDLDTVVDVTRNAIAHSECFALFDTLEYLVKGGRAGKAKALLGTILKIKPMIIVKGGEVHELGKVRTFAKGIARLKDVVKRFAPLDSLCVLHSTTLDIAQEVADDLRELLPEGHTPFVTRFGPVMGVYVGPGALGIGLLRSGDNSG